MKVYYDILKEDIISNKETVIAIGNFDGVHTGHRTILNKLKNSGDNLNKIIITFKPHPVLFVNPNKKLKLIVSDYSDKVKILSDFNPDIIVLQYFNNLIKNASPEDFITTLKKKFNMKYLIVGDDYNFGKNRSGNVEFLKNSCKNYDFTLEVIPQVEKNGIRITSSLMRKLIRIGDVENANKYLSYFFFMKGFVQTGFRRGRTLGFPTVNLKHYAPNQLIPQDGVYLTLTKIEGDDKIYHSITNIGNNPTFEDEETKIETHILDFNKNIYFKKIKIHYLKKLRDEIKFSNIDELKQQISKDKEKAIKEFQNINIGNLKLFNK